MILQPIDSLQKTRILTATEEFLQRASELFHFRYQPLMVSFDLKGRAAGQYRVNRNGRWIRYNPYLFARYFQNNLDNTVPHEVAHYVVDRLYGIHRVRPHGEEWKRVMRVFGASPRATASYDLTGIPVRQQQRFPYRCNCREHSLTSIRHNRIINNRAIYRCRACRSALVFAGL